MEDGVITPRSSETEPVSLYIPCYNGEKYLARCLTGVRALDPGPAEILVIDDGSVDRSVQIAADFPTRIIRHQTNLGLAAARNTGVKAARHELVASLDVDCVPRPDWLGLLLDEMNDERIAGACGKLEELHITNTGDCWRSLHLAQTFGDEYSAHAPFLFGFGSLFRKSALMRVGLYNVKLRTNAEDCCVSEDLRNAGYRLVYQPRAVVDHMKTDTALSVLRAYHKYNFFGYLEDITVFRGARRIAYHFLRSLPAMARLDVSARRWDCLAVTVAAILHAAYQDAKYTVLHRGEKRMFDRDS
jgi:GT2 family glycosyltransferase